MTLKELEKLYSLLNKYAEYLKHYKADPLDPFRGYFCHNDCDHCNFGVQLGPTYSIECALDIISDELCSQMYIMRKRG